MEVVTLENKNHAMDFQMESNPSTPYVSAPTSPNRTSFNYIPSFYSSPGSPIHGLTTAPFAWESEPGLIKGTKIDFDSDNFEFEISPKFENTLNQHQNQQQEQQQPQKVKQLPAMSFAEELFCNGQVLTLKPPPRLQHGSTRRSTLPSSVLCGPFPGLGFKNKDFDPFMVALENVRKETRIQGRRPLSLKKIKHAAGDMRKTAIVPHRHKQSLFVCLGFSSKGVRNMN